MSVSFIINSTGKAKELGEMNNGEINNLCDLLSGSVYNVSKSKVSVVKNDEDPIRLSELSVDALTVLKSSVSNYRNGHTREVHMHYNDTEKDLIIALIKCNMNVSKAARELHQTRDKVREDIKHFRLQWGIDLNTYVGLSKAYNFALGS